MNKVEKQLEEIGDRLTVIERTVDNALTQLLKNQKQPEGEYEQKRKAGKDSTIKEILDNGYKVMYADKERKENEVALETYRQATTEKQEEWREKLNIKCSEWFEEWDCGCIDELAIERFIDQLLSERDKEIDEFQRGEILRKRVEDNKYRHFLTSPIQYIFTKTKGCKVPIRVEILCEDRELIDQIIKEISKLLKEEE